VIAGTQNETARIIGTTPATAGLRLRHVDRLVHQLSLGGQQLRVAVIGATTADNLELTDKSIGSTIYIGGCPSI